MARAIGSIFGKVIGKIGDYSIRNVNGKTVIAARPKHYRTSNAAQSVETRQKFAVTNAFSKAVKELPSLYEIWIMNKGSNTTGFHTIFKYNYNLSSSQAPTVNNIITPYGFSSPVTEISVNMEKLIGTLSVFDPGIRISPTEISLSINTVICFSNPNAEDEPFYKMISLSSEVAGYDFSKTYDFEIGLKPEEEDLVAHYSQKIIYIAVVTKSADNKIIRYSQSYSKIAE